MSALALVLSEGPVAQLRRDEADQAANANVRHLVALDTSVDPGARDLQEARRLTRVPQTVSELLCCVHGELDTTRDCEFSQSIHESFMILNTDVFLKKEADDVVAEAMRLPLLAVAVQRIDHRLWQTVPGPPVLDEVIHHLVERLPARFFHPLLQPGADLQRDPDADAR